MWARAALTILIGFVAFCGPSQLIGADHKFSGHVQAKVGKTIKSEGVQVVDFANQPLALHPARISVLSSSLIGSILMPNWSMRFTVPLLNSAPGNRTALVCQSPTRCRAFSTASTGKGLVARIA